ncbi:MULTISPECIES: glycoside hydrolase family 9 protein [Deefgea]|uniref:Endoglucanase-like protein n=1 Tax=Deefgea chitinilytica TaxID=570276 RepID=A0ABS2C8P8_9NEIS|nr:MULTISPECIES: glycoside hydrolase family 9 protein [Deefgea]MBM5570529.1 endoglucanase-like protein [Deefgea chitinilytica]MBM9887758.1 glycoside hydrolase family 9 protein [Deefgea sp. CFH1-16]
MNFLFNHIGFAPSANKVALIEAPVDQLEGKTFTVFDANTRHAVFRGAIHARGMVAKWKNWHFWAADFSEFTQVGEYFIVIDEMHPPLVSHRFAIGDDLFAGQMLSDIVHYIKGQRCTGIYNIADLSRPKWNSDERRDVSGGWYDASGDCSKYLSHLAFSQYMNPQQTPQVVWNLIDGHSRLPQQLKWFDERMIDEALHGADFLVRMQDPAGYFYMTVFDQWSKDENRRDICEYKTQKGDKYATYQAAYRQGGGMAIAALARASQLSRDGEGFTRADYLLAASRGFAHLEQHNIEYLGDQTENIIDDYCALLAAIELLNVSEDAVYATAAEVRVNNILARQDAEGWFRADDKGERSYFHAAEAGLLYISLMRFIEVWPESNLVGAIRTALRKAYQFELKITFADVNNPFGYPRQYVKHNGLAGNTQFFIPHQNESGYWWQGENARLGSIVAAAAQARHLFADDAKFVADLARYEQASLDWILGANPYDACMLQGWGRNNPRYEPGFYNAPGGVCNGITSGFDDEDDIDFKTAEVATMANSWRWTEQWMPHGAWLFLALCHRIQH